MAKKKISLLPAATDIQEADLFVIVQGGVTKKATAGMLLIPATAAEALGLRQAAFFDLGTSAGTVAAGDHEHENGEEIGGPYTLRGVDNAPAGTIILVPRNTAPTEYLVANGPLLSRAAFPNLWKEAQESGNLVTEAVWFSGQFGSYSTGNGSTTFRIPNLCGYVLRAWDAGRGVDPGRALGSAQADAIQNITGTFGADDMTSAKLSGAFYNSGAFAYDAGSSWSGGGYAVGFDASRVVRTALETRMKNIALLPCIKFTSGGQP